MTTLLYITSSSYSGSTLLSFLLNTHPDIFTVSEMEGWRYEENEKFDCSCGKPLEQCRFYSFIKEVFHRNSLSFDFRSFGTKYRLSDSDRINRYLTAQIPFCTSTKLEKMRDRLVRLIPYFRRKIAQCDLANLTFIESALEYGKAKIFVDATKDPHRIHLLNKIAKLNISILYLVRDFHGVTLSIMENKKCSARKGFFTWLNEQERILRIAEEYSGYRTIYYEDLCNDVNKSLFQIHDFVGLEPFLYSGNFKNGEHHILGNTMRLKKLDKVVNSERWRRDMSKVDIELINYEAIRYMEHNPGKKVTEVLKYYVST